MKIYISNFADGRKIYSTSPMTHTVNDQSSTSEEEYDFADEKMLQDFMDNPLLYNVSIEEGKFVLTKK